MFNTVAGYVIGTTAFAFVCHYVGMDWRLALALIHDATYGRFVPPSVQMNLRDLKAI